MSATFLLDVNVLIALSWPTHVAHERVQKWFSKYGGERWATCPFTQAAFVRVLSNPAFSPGSLTIVDALKLLESNLKHRGHRFWPDNIGILEATKNFQSRITGHQQVSDAYLLGLTLEHKGKFATLDNGVVELIAEKGEQRDVVTLI